MAYEAQLAGRVRSGLKPYRGVTEKEQFGGVAFLVRGSLACGVIGKDLMLRVGPHRHDEAMRSKHARPFSQTGRPSRGCNLVRPTGIGSSTSLRRWVEMGVDFVKALPPK